jgi:hypothetical protein
VSHAHVEAADVRARQAAREREQGRGSRHLKTYLSSRDDRRCAMLLGAGLCGAGRAHAAAGAAVCAGPGRVVTGGVHWGVRRVCAGGVRAASRPCIAGFPPVGIGVRAAAARAECG